MGPPLFKLGTVVATPGAMAALARTDQAPAGFLRRHLALDRGCLDAEDHQFNWQALKDGSRIFSAFSTSAGDKIWIITDATDDSGRRASTCILTPGEY